MDTAPGPETVPGFHGIDRVAVAGRRVELPGGGYCWTDATLPTPDPEPPPESR
ncbi:hypothetical protein [Streptomyces violaceusniger]|uniref:hypothetical protein n=1 Tax=Streptomyces violaceusniger TaxID=68280 RepID=UPI0001E4CAC4|nr:hypothetical protein [Streptomyces violaceusniger]